MTAKPPSDVRNASRCKEGPICKSAYYRAMPFVLYLILTLAPISAVAGDTQEHVHKASAGNEQISDATLRQVAVLVNKTLPRKVVAPDGPSNATLERVRVDPSLQFIFEVTMLNRHVPLAKIASMRQKLDATLQESMPDSVCVATSVRGLLDGGVTIGYEYRDADGSLLAAILITPGECARLHH